MTTYAIIITVALLYVFIRSLYVIGQKQDAFQQVLMQADFELSLKEKELQALRNRNAQLEYQLGE